MSGERTAVDSASVWPDDVDAEEGYVVNWFVREGGRVDAGEAVCEFQVEKVSVDVPAPAAGELDEIVVAEDDEFRRGDTLGWIRSA